MHPAVRDTVEFSIKALAVCLSVALALILILVALHRLEHGETYVIARSEADAHREAAVKIYSDIQEELRWLVQNEANLAASAETDPHRQDRLEAVRANRAKLDSLRKSQSRLQQGKDP